MGVEKLYAKSGEARRKMACQGGGVDYYGIKLVVRRGELAFLRVSQDEFYPFVQESDRVPAWLSARASASWPRPAWLDEATGEFIDTRSGEHYPFSDDPYNRRYVLDCINYAENKRQAEIPATSEVTQPTPEYTI